MKLVLLIVQNEDADNLEHKLIKDGFSTTKLATTGGFLKAGNTTLIVGTGDENVDRLLKIVEENCKERIETITSPIISPFNTGLYANMPQEIKMGGATVFVLNVERYEKL